ncbi:hypothetical protein Ngar_c09330 [Candidatus Nitrososphaera gargensis Ga9.2]|uniref:Uncharacterized protein n=1 Tax=Nitrososphaera gargensis (strain Ga9.2) TaxID=1237085 RepID=K0IDS5_NITGG|nr:hypothetical protein [Candidatus Nitrososphaera gargensis]AFU57018.1 hypothetical protein Ngar_c00680 [Candidatus Nitrososphaera gargensis Ga9.2]AFU57875.1 hypothetical protein Ngar_c09330 [Candidatus Nitrososphaera gargensis Ga9.2]
MPRDALNILSVLPKALEGNIHREQSPAGASMKSAAEVRRNDRDELHMDLANMQYIASA